MPLELFAADQTKRLIWLGPSLKQFFGSTPKKSSKHYYLDWTVALGMCCVNKFLRMVTEDVTHTREQNCPKLFTRSQYFSPIEGVEM